jgi:hypothetical protein
VKTFEQFRNRMLLCSVAAAVSISAVLGLIRPDYGFGFLIGAGASILNLHLMAARTSRLVQMDAQTAKGHAFRYAISRYVLLALSLILAAKLDKADFVCAACGVFLAQAVLVTDHMLPSRSGHVAIEGE